MKQSSPVIRRHSTTSGLSRATSATFCELARGGTHPHHRRQEPAERRAGSTSAW